MTGPRRVALQEDILSGLRPADRFASAANLGLQGIDSWSREFATQVDATAMLAQPCLQGAESAS